jgi:outer membrane protein assembly factor BamB
MLISQAPGLGPQASRALALVVVACWGTIGAARAVPATWPQFRGPGARGIAEGSALPDRWSTTENVAWKVPVPGTGWSSPIVAGDRIFVTSVISASTTEKPTKGLYFGGERPASTAEHRWMVTALDLASGRTLWTQEAHRAVPSFARHLKNSYASETPITDGERVYVSFGNIGIFCYDLDGRLLWSQRAEPVRMRNGWGTASSPALHDGRLFVVNDNDDQSSVSALDARTGKTIWRAPRDEGSNWSTPYVWQHSGRTELVTTGTRQVRSYGLDGALLWQLRGMSTIVIPTPFSAHGLLYVASGYVGDTHRPAYAIRPGAKGDISPGEPDSTTFVAWHQPQGGPYNPSPLVYGDLYYTLYDRGFFTAHDARSGAEVYGKQRIDAEASAFTASPWAYNGKIFAMSEDGVTYVIRAGATYELLGRNTLDEFAMATPAITADSLIIRTASAVYRIRSRPSGGP